MEAFTEDFPPEVNLGNNRKIRHEQGRGIFTVNAPQAVIIGLFNLTKTFPPSSSGLYYNWLFSVRIPSNQSHLRLAKQEI